MNYIMLRYIKQFDLLYPKLHESGILLNKTSVKETLQENQVYYTMVAWKRLLDYFRSSYGVD